MLDVHEWFRHGWRCFIVLLLGTIVSLDGNVRAQSTQEPSSAAPSENPAENWVRSPHVIKFGDYATIQVPAGMKCRFGNKETARATVLDAGKERQQKLAGVIIPTIQGEKTQSWRITFYFDPIGYVKTEGASSLDASALLDRYVQGLASLNDRRRLAGQHEIQEFLWTEPPVLDPALPQMRWNLRQVIEGGDRVEFGVCRLGRHGIMTMKFEADAKEYETMKRDLDDLAAALEFTSGNRYEDYRVGDKIATKPLPDLIIEQRATSRMAALKAFLTSTTGLVLIFGGSLLFLGILVGLVVLIAKGKGKVAGA